MDTGERKVGLVGFICPANGAPIEFSQCIGDCQCRCMSLPMIMAMAASSRTPEEGVYHVTEILNPPQVVYLSRNNAYYAHPSSLIWMLFGTGFHRVMEDGCAMTPQGKYISEQHFTHKFSDDITLSGTPDLYDVDNKILYDYKTIKGYGAKLMKNGDFSGNKYKDQLNIYRAYAFPEAEKLIIEAVIKDWNMDMELRDGLSQVEDIVVPVEPIEAVKDMVERRISVLEQCRITKEAPECSMDEQWVNLNPRSKNYGVPIRCRDFCPVHDLCPQWRQYLEEEH